MYSALLLKNCYLKRKRDFFTLCRKKFVTSRLCFSATSPEMECHVIVSQTSDMLTYQWALNLNLLYFMDIFTVE